MPPKARKTPGAAEFVPEDHSLTVLREALQCGRGGDLFRNAAQAGAAQGLAISLE